METGTVYCATNLANQKVYIGQTVQTPKQRKQVHVAHAKRGRAHFFGRALMVHGADNFKWTILCKVSAPTKLLVKEYLDIAEQMYIQQYDSIDNSKGYNLTKGGDGLVGFTHTESTKKKMSKAQKGENNPMFGKRLSEEVRRKMSESHKGRVVTLETRKKLSETKKGAKNPMFGKHPSKETREKRSKAMRGEKGPWFGKHHSEETRDKLSEANKGE